MEAFQLIGSGKKIFYGGAKGGGKSFLGLGSAVLVATQFPGIRIVIIRRYYQELEERFIQVLKEKFPSDIFGYKWSERKKTAFFDNNAKIVMKALETEGDVKKVKGLEYQYMVIDEANEFTEIQVEYLEGSLRNPDIPNFTATLLMTGNPGGVSDLYFKTHFVNPDYKRWRPNELKYKDKFIFIPAKVQDNPWLSSDNEYIEKLDGMSEHYRQAWLLGNWNVFMGQFFEEWNVDVHVIESKPIPKAWERQFGFDLGFTEKHPSFGVWAAQDPDTLDIHIYREYLRAVPASSAELYASDIIELSEHEEISMAWADPSIFGKRTVKADGEVEYDKDSPGYIFLRMGFPMMPANNDRIQGWRIMKQWMHWSERKRPKLFIHDCCITIIEIIPTLRYNSKLKGGNSEDLNTEQKLDDVADAIRYLLTSGYRYPTVGDYKERDESEYYVKERPLSEEEKEELKSKLSNKFMSSDYDDEDYDVSRKFKQKEENVSMFASYR
jgi:phage terminase large subunit